jgi:hypothetical protein
MPRQPAYKPRVDDANVPAAPLPTDGESVDSPTFTGTTTAETLSVDVLIVGGVQIDPNEARRAREEQELLHYYRTQMQLDPSRGPCGRVPRGIAEQLF